MKRRAFGFITIFLVIFQMFSPWMVNISKEGISVKKNVAEAMTRNKVAEIHADAFLVVTGIVDNQSLSVSLFSDTERKITAIKSIEYIREDNLNTPEFGCPAGNTVLVSNPNLTNPAPATSFVGLDLPNTEARGYLKQDFVFPISNFSAKCIENRIGQNQYGHYKFTYSVLSTDNKTFDKTESTQTGDAVESLASKITSPNVAIVYIKMVPGTGDSFNVEWGRIRDTAFSENDLIAGNGMIGNLEVKGSSSIELKDDRNTRTKGSMSVKFLQDAQDRTLYTLKRSETVNIKPRTDGTYELFTSWGGASARSIYDPKKNTGTQYSWASLNTSYQQNIEIPFSNANYIMKDYSIRKLTPATFGDKTVLDIDISMLINTTESRSFIPWNDVDGDGKASSRDIPGGDWDNFTRDFNSPEIDRRSAKDGNGFYLLYSSTNTNPEVGGAGVNEINLNPYIFGEKVYSPIISESKTGMVFGLEPLEVDKNKTYYFRLYANEQDPWFDDNGYTSTISIAIPNSIDQISRGGAVLIESGEDAGAGPAWLPTCEATDAKTWFQGCLVVGFYYLIFVPTSYLLGIAGTILDFVLAYSIQSDAYKVGYIVDAWRFIRDACNLFFIFILIYLAFKLMLGIGQGTKQLIVNTLIVATVINFSYPLTTVVIDISNITARQLYYNAFSKKADDGKPLSLSSAAAEGYNPQKIVLEGVSSRGREVTENAKGSIFMVLLVGVVFNIIAMIMFLKIALQFIYRILGLIFAIILSPLAVFSFSLSPGQRGKMKMVGFESWLEGLMQDAFKAPVFLFLIMVLLLFVNNNPFKNVFKEGVDGIDWWMSIIVPFMLIVGFFKVIESVTKSMTSSIAQITGGAIIKGVGAVAGVAMGGAALAGSGIIGKGMGKIAEGKMGQRIMDRSVNGKGLSSWVAKKQVKAMRAMQGGSYDIRQTGAMNAVSRESGANFNSGTRIIDRGLGMVGAGAIGLSTGMTAGGYMAMGDRRNKEREEYLKLVQHDRNLESRIKDKKDAIEDKKKEKEVALKDQKAAARDADRLLKEKEDAKKKAEDDFNEYDKLEELINKRLDVIAKTPPGTQPPTNDIDSQIQRLEAKLTNGQGGLINTTGNNKTLAANYGLTKKTLSDKKDEAKDQATKAKTASENLKTAVNGIEDEIRVLDKGISELTKAIENVKNNRANAYAHQIRNKSGKIYRRETYRQEMNGTDRNYNAEQDHAFSAASGGEDLRNEMRNIITQVEERSTTPPNNERSARVIVTNTILGGVAGAFTGGLGAVAVGAGTGGLVGVARTYRPENENFRNSGDAGNWRPSTNDGYTAPSN